MLEHYRNITGAIQDQYSGCLQSNGTVWGCVRHNHNVTFDFIKCSPSALNLKNIKLHIVTDIKVNAKNVISGPKTGVQRAI